eukprot:scaffold50472_cov93-Phaeocystis_antarctica.AAC.2
MLETCRLDHVPEQPLISRSDFEQVDLCGCASVVRGRGLGVAVAAVAAGERLEVAGVDLLGVGQQVALPPAIASTTAPETQAPAKGGRADRRRWDATLRCGGAGLADHFIAFVGTNLPRDRTPAHISALTGSRSEVHGSEERTLTSVTGDSRCSTPATRSAHRTLVQPLFVPCCFSTASASGTHCMRAPKHSRPEPRAAINLKML